MRRFVFRVLCCLAGVSGGAANGQEIPNNLRVLQPSYVSPMGRGTNTGTFDSPYSLDQALSKANKNSVLIFLPGTYPSITVTKSGVMLRAYQKWAARVAGSPGKHGITVVAGATNVVIDGLEIARSYIDGIKLNSGGNTIRNCWIHHSGWGDPNAQTNSDASYTGQGINAVCKERNTIEYNLVEWNGIWNGHDHGIYISGTNHVIRGNVLRHNWTYGLQLYTGYTNESCSGIRVYSNLIYGNGMENGGRNCITVWAGPPGTTTQTTNYVFNNTLLAGTYYPVIADAGFLALSNNIILGAYDGSLSAENGATIWCDYNLFTNSVSANSRIVNGGHNIRVADPGLVNPGKGLYWLTPTSPARAKATPAPRLDFFGRTQASGSDIGAVPYVAELSSDTRELDPSPANPDYWSLPLNL